MARPLRLEFEGALYHVTSRGDGGEDIYLSDGDRRRFLEILGDVWERFNWTIHAHCLMTNHYHLVVETPDANLSKGMRQLNGVYTQAFNRAHNRVGHVFQGRYKGILVEKENHLVELARYVVLNPVRAGMVGSPEQWPWSSYRGMVGEEAAPKWLETRSVLAVFGSDESEAVDRYVRFVAQGIGAPSPWAQLKHQVFLGSDAFLEQMMRKVPRGRDLREIPQSKARPKAQTLAAYERAHPERNRAIAQAYASGGYTMQEIGDYFGLHYSRVSKIIRAAPQVARKAKGKT
jgi:REP element-mobilizing transposase RayT